MRTHGQVRSESEPELMLMICSCSVAFIASHLHTYTLHYSKRLFWLFSFQPDYTLLYCNLQWVRRRLCEVSVTVRLRRASLCLYQLLLLSTYLLEAPSREDCTCGIDIKLSLCLWLSWLQLSTPPVVSCFVVYSWHWHWQRWCYLIRWGFEDDIFSGNWFTTKY